MNIDRLNYLIHILEQVPASSFDLDDWRTEDCGTSACALGWAGMDAKFNADGFRLNTGENSWEPMYKDWRGFHAASKFFDLNLAQVNDLFHPDTYPYSPRPTPANVIGRIKNLIEEHS